MKSLKVLSIIGIIISGIGAFGSFLLLIDADIRGFSAMAIYGYFLAYSIVSLTISKRLK